MRVTWSSAATEPREAGCVSTRRASRGLRALSLTGCCRAGRAASGAVCSLARQNDERQPRHYFLTSTTTRSRCRCRRRRRGASTTNCRRPSSLPSDSPSFPFELGEVALGVADHALEAALKLNVIHAVVRSIVRGRQALPGCGAQVGSGGGEGHQGRSPGTSRVSAAGEISLDSWVSRACFQCNAQGYWHCFRSRDASESQARRDHVIDPAMTERLPYLDAILCLDGLGAPYGDHAETRASRAMHPNGGVFYCHGLRARDA